MFLNREYQRPPTNPPTQSEIDPKHGKSFPSHDMQARLQKKGLGATIVFMQQNLKNLSAARLSLEKYLLFSCKKAFDQILVMKTFVLLRNSGLGKFYFKNWQLVPPIDQDKNQTKELLKERSFCWSFSATNNQTPNLEGVPSWFSTIFSQFSNSKNVSSSPKNARVRGLAGFWKSGERKVQIPTTSTRRVFAPFGLVELLCQSGA